MNRTRIFVLVDSKISSFGSYISQCFHIFWKIIKAGPRCLMQTVLGYATVEVSLTTGSLRLVLVSFVEHLSPPGYFKVEYWRYL